MNLMRSLLPDFSLGKISDRKGCRALRKAENRLPKLGPRYTHKQNRTDVVQEGKNRLAAGAEIAAEAKMNPCKNAVEDIAAQVLSAEANDLCAACRLSVGKECDKLFRAELYPDADAKPEANGNADGIA